MYGTRAGTATYFAKLARRDALHEALGDPPIKPSRIDRIERGFEDIEEHSFEEGQTYFEEKQSEVLLLEVVDEMARMLRGVPLRRAGAAMLHSRGRWKLALERVLAQRKKDKEIPF